MRKPKHAAALAAATLTFAAGSTGLVGAATTAQASSCGAVQNIGSPASVYLGSVYAGQAEQQFVVCPSADYARVHWQWSGNIAPYPNSSMHANIVPASGSGGVQMSTGINYESAGKDVYSGWTDIHTANPDTWAVFAEVDNQACAWGSWHVYATGANIPPEYPTGC